MRDGLDWERLDEHVGIGLSKSGWDSHAMAYPWVERDGDRYVLYYNGNDYGREGFGLAVAAAWRGAPGDRSGPCRRCSPLSHCRS